MLNRLWTASQPALDHVKCYKANVVMDRDSGCGKALLFSE